MSDAGLGGEGRLREAAPAAQRLEPAFAPQHRGADRRGQNGVGVAGKFRLARVVDRDVVGVFVMGGGQETLVFDARNDHHFLAGGRADDPGFVIGLIAPWFMPETKGRPLPD